MTTTDDRVTAGLHASDRPPESRRRLWAPTTSLLEHAPLIAAVFVYWLAALILGAPVRAVPLVALSYGVSAWMVIAAAHLATILLERPGRHPAERWVKLSRWLRIRARAPEVALRLPMAVCCVGVLMLTFAALKPQFANLTSYVWDPELAHLDRWLHGGIDPWRWTHALPGRDSLSLFLDRVYLLWFPVVPLSHLAVILFAERRLRLQYLLSIVFMWAVVGSALAIMFGSGGPVYYEGLAGDGGGFEPLVAYLSESRLTASTIQARLWTMHNSGAAVPFSGISAMPSVHVGAAALIAFAGMRAHPLLAAAGTTFWALVLLGSVHLGWHYALDGYVATALAAAGWWASGQVARQWLDRSPVGAAHSRGRRRQTQQINTE